MSMNIETIHRHLSEINKLIDILDTKQSIRQIPDEVAGTTPKQQIQTNTRTFESLSPIPNLPNPREVKTIQTEILSATSISPQTPQNISALRDVMIPGTHTHINDKLTSVTRPENIPIHMNGGGKISRDKPKSDDIYYTISILDLDVTKTP
jgi:hypothetical protein